MRDMSFIRVDPETRIVQFGLFPEVLEGFDKLVQECYLTLLSALAPFLKLPAQNARDRIVKAIRNVEFNIKNSQTVNELPSNERLAQIDIVSIEQNNNIMQIELNIVSMSRASATTTLSIGG